MPVVLPFKLKIWFYRKNPCEPVKKFVRCQIDKLLQDTGGGGGRHVEMLVEMVPWRKIPTSVVRGQGGGGLPGFRKKMLVEGAGGPVALQTSPDGRERYRGGKFRLLQCAVGNGEDRRNFRAGMMLAGAGGPVALQTSPPVRRPKSVDTDPHAALAGLTCRASPANSSVAGGAALDSVRLRRNCSLLLCVSQSSSLTCARGADRACAREKAGLRGEI